MNLKPSQIYFSQDSINNRFDKRSRHSGMYIGETLDELINGDCSVSNIPTISVCHRNGKWVTADNRRLWVFRKLEELGYCSTIPVIQTGYIPSQKCTSMNGGVSVVVRGIEGGRKWRRIQPKDSTPKVNPPQPVFRSAGLSSRSMYTQNTIPERETVFQEPLFRSRSTQFNKPSNLYPPTSSYQSSRPLFESFGDFTPELDESFASFNDGIKQLDPKDIRYTKEKIKLIRHAGLSYDPIKVYEVFGENWVMDGNKRLYVYKERRRFDPFLKIRATVSEDKDEFLEKIREDKPGLSLIEILQMGEDIEVQF